VLVEEREGGFVDAMGDGGGIHRLFII
jgi:hypothetical protein